MSRDMKAACLLLCISIVMFVIVTPNFVDNPGLPGISPSYFPNLATVILGVCSLFLIFIEIFRMRSAGEKTTPDRVKSTSHSDSQSKFDAFRPFIVALILLIYFYLFEHVGFLTTTPIIIALLMVTLGQRNYKVIVGTGIVVTFVLFELFDKGLGLPLQ